MRWFPVAAFGATTVGLFAYSVIVARHAFGSALFLGIAGGVLVVTVRALYRAAQSLFIEPPTVELAVATGRRRKELEREKALLLKALKELDFDHQMHKVSDEDFAEIGGAYRVRAIRVMRQLDDTKVDYAALVEEELTKKRGGPRVAAAAAAAAAEAARPVAAAGATTTATNSCPQCSASNDADAVFCKRCAHRLVGEVVA